eukprot:TRINITY_DN4208_c2_g1_i6.p1 TRINITY_DN4208_c2_g1~~TRINITY_DN4208_c2_g1_i6.p1  ORF type:complete len:1301 (+),score=270.41 TRINITY_DN4208_c2_g1_i6:201-4103(+)
MSVMTQGSKRALPSASPASYSAIHELPQSMYSLGAAADAVHLHAQYRHQHRSAHRANDAIVYTRVDGSRGILHGPLPLISRLEDIGDEEEMEQEGADHNAQQGGNESHVATPITTTSMASGPPGEEDDLVLRVVDNGSGRGQPATTTSTTHQHQHDHRHTPPSSPASAGNHSDLESSGSESDGSVGADCPHIAGFQLDNVREALLDPSKWYCKECCNTECTWACLSCAEVGCGRFQSSHALAHYKKTEHPLVLEINTRYCHCYNCNGYVGGDNLSGEIAKLRSLLEEVQTLHLTSPEPSYATTNPDNHEQQDAPSRYYLTTKWQEFYVQHPSPRATNNHQPQLEQQTRVSTTLRTATRVCEEDDRFSFSEDSTGSFEEQEEAVAHQEGEERETHSKGKEERGSGEEEKGKEEETETCSPAVSTLSHQQSSFEFNIVEDEDDSDGISLIRFDYEESLTTTTTTITTVTETIDPQFDPADSAGPEDLIIACDGYGDVGEPDIKIEDMPSSNAPSDEPANKPEEGGTVDENNSNSSNKTKSKSRGRRAKRELIGLGLVCDSDRPAKADITVVPQRGQSAIPGQTGLRNLGNTCFMNAVLQALSNTLAFREFFVMKFLPKDKKGKLSRRETLDCLERIGTHGPPTVQDVSMSAELHNIFRVVWSGKWAVITPFALLDALWKFVPHFRNYQQQDAQEFLVFLLDRLHDELKDANLSSSPAASNTTSTASSPHRNRGSEQPSIISQTFQGQLRSQVTCASCGKISSRVEPFFDLSLDIPVQHSCPSYVRRTRNKTPPPTCHITDCLDSYTSPENLDDAYHCEFCNTKQEATKTLSIEVLPNVLCLVLKRFCWNKVSRAKVDTDVQFPLTSFDMSPYSTEKTNTLYDLKSVVIHHGTGLRVGHYTAFCYNADRDCWLNFNDSRVSVVSDEEVTESQAYILFYERKPKGIESSTAGASPFKIPRSIMRSSSGGSLRCSVQVKPPSQLTLDDENETVESEEEEKEFSVPKTKTKKKKSVIAKTRKQVATITASEAESGSHVPLSAAKRIAQQKKQKEDEDKRRMYKELSRKRKRDTRKDKKEHVSSSSDSESEESDPPPPPKPLPKRRGRPPTTKEGKLKRQREDEALAQKLLEEQEAARAERRQRKKRHKTESKDAEPQKQQHIFVTVPLTPSHSDDSDTTPAVEDPQPPAPAAERVTISPTRITITLGNKRKVGKEGADTTMSSTIVLKKQKTSATGKKTTSPTKPPKLRQSSRLKDKQQQHHEAEATAPTPASVVPGDGDYHQPEEEPEDDTRPKPRRVARRRPRR